MSHKTIKTLLAGAAALAIAATAAHAEEKVLHVYNWADYIGETTIADFEAETGIKVVYDTYDSSETADTKLITGNSGYDVVIHAGSFIPRLIQAGVLAEIDRSRLSNYKHLDTDILKTLESWDQGNNFSVPYMWGTTGITYNVDMIKERMPDAPLGSLDLIMKPEIISKFADCGISLLDSPLDVMPMVLSYLGLDPNTEDRKDYKKAQEALLKIRSHVTTFDNTNYLNALPNKERCIAMTWSGDYAVAASRAADAGVDVNLAYFMPKEGTGAWFDVWVIPKDAPHMDAAHQWIDYMMRPDVIAKATNFIWYANANKDATELVDPAISGDKAVYPPQELVKTMYTQKTLPPKIERARTRAWTAVKTGG